MKTQIIIDNKHTLIRLSAAMLPPAGLLPGKAMQGGDPPSPRSIEYISLTLAPTGGVIPQGDRGLNPALPARR